MNTHSPETNRTPEADPSKMGRTTGPKQGSASDFLRRVDTWWSVLILLFCFTAGCGLPFLWVSKAYSLPGKILVSILVTLYTLALLWVFFVIMAWVWAQISGSL